MQTFRELCNNDLNVAIRATIDGLLGQERIGWLKLDMAVFAWPDGNNPAICCACAATLAILELKFPLEVPMFPVSEYQTSSRRANFLDVQTSDLEDFEHAIDGLRQGLVWRLYDYFDKGGDYFGIEHDWSLQNDTWEEELHLLIHYYQQASGVKFVPSRQYSEADWQQGVFDRLAAFERSLILEGAH